MCVFKQDYFQHNVLNVNNYSNSYLILAYFKILAQSRLHFQQGSILYEKEFLSIFSFLLGYDFTPILYISFIYLLNPIIIFLRSRNTFHRGLKIFGIAIKNNEGNL